MNYIVINGNKIPTEVAIDQYEQENGLMFRKSAPQALSFIYPRIQRNIFWMKNTYVPLDIIFCRAGLVQDVKEGVPHSLRHIGNDLFSNIVIEMPRGAAERLSIVTGTEVHLSLDLQTFARRAEQLTTHL